MSGDISDRFGAMWRKSREDAGKSQDYVAKKLGVSKKTVQNWEAGYSAPNQMKGFEWFRALDLQPLPYYLSLLYPDQYSNIDPEDDKQITRALIQYITDCSPSERRKLLFVVSGTHEGSTAALLELITAYMHLTLWSRVKIAQEVLTDYEITEAKGQLRQHIAPDIDLLTAAIDRSIKSVKNGEDTY